MNPIPPAVAHVTLTGLAAMPRAGSRSAPDEFDGDPEALEDFLDRFEGLAIAAQLTNEDKFKALLLYVTRKQKMLFETLNGFQTKVWDDWIAAIKDVFPTKTQTRRYTKRTLITLVRKYHQRQIYNEEDLMTYYRDFITVANWLLQHNKITPEDRSYYFWFGFHPSNRAEMEQYLRFHHPAHDRSEAWPFADVFASAKYLYNSLAFDQQTPHFPAVPVAVTYQEPRRYLDDDLDLDLELEEEDLPEVADVKRDRLRRAAARETIRRSVEPPSEVQQTVTKTVQFNPQPVRQVARSDDEELENLVGQLSTLNFNDSRYAIAFAKLTNRFPTVSAQFPKPRIAGAAVQTIQTTQTTQTTNPQTT